MPQPISTTSGVAAGISVVGFQLQAGNGQSPETFTSVCNVSDWTEPLKAETADVTNVGDLWRRRISTLLDMGTLKFKVFWVMTEATHENAVSGNIRGLRYLMVNQTLVNWIAIYPNGTTPTNGSRDYFPAYVTAFNITGKVGDVFTAEIELSNSGAPTLQ